LRTRPKTPSGGISSNKKWAEDGGRKEEFITPAHNTYVWFITTSAHKKFSLRKININNPQYPYKNGTKETCCKQGRVMAISL